MGIGYGFGFQKSVVASIPFRDEQVGQSNSKSPLRRDLAYSAAVPRILSLIELLVD